jgi:predicted DCC family thiol-disulfide oxidoreductase YuxK
LVNCPVVFYDGVCGLCNRWVQFILKRDAAGVFRFAPLQSRLAERVLARHGVQTADLDTVYVVVNPDLDGKDDEERAEEFLLMRSDAVLFVMGKLGGICSSGTWIPRVLPRAVRNWGYGLVARHRYRMFGRYDTCPVPSEATRGRFLDL